MKSCKKKKKKFFFDTKQSKILQLKVLGSVRVCLTFKLSRNIFSWASYIKAAN